ncbi:hydroxymethylbilane synthase [Oleispirillum naphthae]|uniref:hydroxymethylbilane synthase n=1 Tax=Oleispirillum naphthae TaxID=2838853 RepID=UPI0030824BCC
MSSSPLLTIGTRGSPLAMAQTRAVAAALAEAAPELAAPDAIAISVIKTTGDAILDRPLAEAGGKGLFTKEIDEAMLDRRIDIAVHSMKDVPTWLPDGIDLPCMLPREDPRDAFLCPYAASFTALPAGAVVGTASLRRGAFVLARRPDLKVETFRGNVQSRLAKLEAGVVDATLLALAGLKRLGLAGRAAGVLSIEEMLPAVAQGAIGVTCRADDARVLDWLARINHPETVVAVRCERAFLRVLDGSCRTPIGGLAQIGAGGRVEFLGRLARTDGSAVFEARRAGGAAEAEAIGADAGAEVKAASCAC